MGHTGNAKREIEVLVMMSQVILLHLTHVLWQLSVMKSVVHAVVKDVWTSSISRAKANEVIESVQKVKAPEMPAFAIAVGNVACTNVVKGY
jgi:hypothetical protein